MVAGRHQGGWASLTLLNSSYARPLQEIPGDHFFSSGEPEQVPTETLPGLPPATPWAWSSHKENCHYSATHLVLKPWKTSGEKKTWLSLTSLAGCYSSILGRQTEHSLFLLVTIFHPATHPSPWLSLWTSVFTSLPHHVFAKCSLQPPPPQSYPHFSTQRTSLGKSTFLFFHKERPTASDNGIKWTSRTLSSKISSHKDWVVMRVVKDR